MPQADADRSSWRVLDPIDRISEALFGLIMVLTFTGTLSAAEAGREDVRMMLIGSLGCNLAWGLIDALFYLMARLSERAQGIAALQAVRNLADADGARRVIAKALPPVIASLVQPAELEGFRQRLAQHADPNAHPRLAKEDWLAALSCFLWVFLCTFPVIIPFVFMHDAMRAMRVSNGIAVALLFVTGYAFGKTARMNAWLTGFAMVLVGVILVAITIALGG
jgi:multidrug transporter EmrE-like cation transporter